MNNDMYKIKVLMEEYERVSIGFGKGTRFMSDVNVARERLLEAIKSAVSDHDE